MLIETLVLLIDKHSSQHCCWFPLKEEKARKGNIQEKMFSSISDGMWNSTEYCSCFTCVCIVDQFTWYQLGTTYLVLARLKICSSNGDICNTTFWFIFFCRAAFFCKGMIFFNQIVSPVKNFHVILGNLLQSLHYLLFSPVFFSFQQVSKCFCSTICNGKMFPISDTWRAAFVGQTRVSISLPVFPTDPIVFPATKRYLITMQYLVIFNISTLVSISLALVQLKK